MKQFFDGYEVSLNRQTLLHGTWNSPNCEWEWDTERHYFFDREAAEKFFNAQRGVCDADCPIIRLNHATITLEGGRYEYDTGDPIKEMANMESGVEVYDI